MVDACVSATGKGWRLVGERASLERIRAALDDKYRATFRVVPQKGTELCEVVCALKRRADVERAAASCRVDIRDLDAPVGGGGGGGGGGGDGSGTTRGKKRAVGSSRWEELSDDEISEKRCKVEPPNDAEAKKHKKKDKRTRDARGKGDGGEDGGEDSGKADNEDKSEVKKKEKKEKREQKAKRAEKRARKTEKKDEGKEEKEGKRKEGKEEKEGKRKEGKEEKEDKGEVKVIAKRESLLKLAKAVPASKAWEMLLHSGFEYVKGSKKHIKGRDGIDLYLTQVIKAASSAQRRQLRRWIEQFSAQRAQKQERQDRRRAEEKRDRAVYRERHGPWVKRAWEPAVRAGLDLFESLFGEIEGRFPSHDAAAAAVPGSVVMLPSGQPLVMSDVCSDRRDDTDTKRRPRVAAVVPMMLSGETGVGEGWSRYSGPPPMVFICDAPDAVCWVSVEFARAARGVGEPELRTKGKRKGTPVRQGAPQIAWALSVRPLNERAWRLERMAGSESVGGPFDEHTSPRNIWRFESAVVARPAPDPDYADMPALTAALLPSTRTLATDLLSNSIRCRGESGEALRAMSVDRFGGAIGSLVARIDLHWLGVWLAISRHLPRELATAVFELFVAFSQHRDHEDDGPAVAVPASPASPAPDLIAAD